MSGRGFPCLDSDCSSKETFVVDSRYSAGKGKRRRRECMTCKKRFWTQETVADVSPSNPAVKALVGPLGQDLSFTHYEVGKQTFINGAHYLVVEIEQLPANNAGIEWYAIWIEKPTPRHAGKQPYTRVNAAFLEEIRFFTSEDDK